MRRRIGVKASDGPAPAPRVTITPVGEVEAELPAIGHRRPMKLSNATTTKYLIWCMAVSFGSQRLGARPCMTRRSRFRRVA